jgi:RNA polymerase sigma-70 factor (ECF subfamily)
MTDDYVRVREVLTRAVARVCPRHLANQREDIVQNALVRILEIQRGGEQNGIRTTSYLWRAAYTATVDEIRRLSRRREVVLANTNPDGPALEVPSSPVDEETKRHLGLEIRHCLGRLAVPRRRAVGLHLLGFRAEEATRVLGGDLKHVRNLTYRGLSDLRACLESRGIRP